MKITQEMLNAAFEAGACEIPYRVGQDSRELEFSHAVWVEDNLSQYSFLTSLLWTACKVGYGYGYGDGYGDVYGVGVGYGVGYGDGDVYGVGYGVGVGYGDGDVYGDGYGVGDGYGDGVGYGDGDVGYGDNFYLKQFNVKETS